MTRVLKTQERGSLEQEAGCLCVGGHWVKAATSKETRVVRNWKSRRRGFERKAGCWVERQETEKTELVTLSRKHKTKLTKKGWVWRKQRNTGRQFVWHVLGKPDRKGVKLQKRTE